MKKFILLVFSLVLCSGLFAGETMSTSLFDAVQKNLVKVVFKGRGYTSENRSAHYGKCILLHLKNVSSQRLELSLEAGRKLHSCYDSVQDMMVSQTEVFALGPGGSSDFTINAFCIEKSETAPKENTVFTMAALAGGYLLQLVQLIESLGCQDNMGQQAVWVLTDNVSPENIKGSDREKEKKLRDFVDFALKKIQGGKIDGVIYDYSFPDKMAGGFKIAGQINWDMPYSGTVTLGVYDNKGKKVADIFAGVPYNKGFQTFTYELASSLFREGELYWLKVISNGERLKEVAITMK